MRAHRFLITMAAAATLGLIPTASIAGPQPPNGTMLGGCDPALTSPDAIECAGYYSGNILNGSPTDITNQQNAIASLALSSFTWGGNWTALEQSTSPDLVITALSGPTGNRLDFGTMLYGQTIVGAHFGNVAGPAGNVSVFWLFDFGTAGGSYVTLDNVQGFSNAALYSTGIPGIPEPATWAMMLVGFGAVGFTIRRRRGTKSTLSHA